MTSAPQNGARFEIARDPARGGGAYTALVLADGARFEAEIAIDESAVRTTWRSEPPRWIADTTHGFLKVLQKNHAADGSWPARLVRWRAERE